MERLGHANRLFLGVTGNLPHLSTGIREALVRGNEQHDARLWHPWLRINRVLRAMLHERWSAEAWPHVKAERRSR